jgi:hypothetical protein
MLRRLLFVLSLAGLVTAALVAPSQAADQVSVPTTVGQTVTSSWQGTVLPGASPSGSCSDSTGDVHEVDLVVPAGTYDSVLVSSTVNITYDGTSDLKLTLVQPDGTSKTADNGSFDEDETLSLSNPAAGHYKFLTCMFAGPTAQPYSGTFTLTAKAIPPPAPRSCAAPKTPLTFSTPSYVDTARAGGEPSVFALPQGRLLYAAHAGTTHFYTPAAADENSAAFAQNYRGQVYAWYSDDRGNTWKYVDRSLPPDNAAGSGFSDPDFAIDTAGNVYLSEINLVNVAVSKSTDSGSSYRLQNFFGMTLTDRQWKAAGPPNVLFMVGNPSGGGTFPTDPAGHNGHTIYRSTDGGQTFSNGVSDPGGAGDIVFDQRFKTLYEGHLSDGKIQVAAFSNSLAPDSKVALTPQLYTVAEGVDELSHWPALDVDSLGNVYIVWDEGGNGDRPAGVYYSFSKDRGNTWAPPTRVDKPVNGTDGTDIWPWIAAGSPGRVAVAWFGNDHALPGQDAEQAGDNDPWNVYVAQTTTGLGCRKSAPAGFRVTKATPEPFHVGTVCMGGTVCQAELVDRRLGDYFTIDVDNNGRLVAAYSDTRQGGSVALPAFFRQSGGPSFSA